MLRGTHLADRKRARNWIRLKAIHHWWGLLLDLGRLGSAHSHDVGHIVLLWWLVSGHDSRIGDAWPHLCGDRIWWDLHAHTCHGRICALRHGGISCGDGTHLRIEWGIGEQSLGHLSRWPTHETGGGGDGTVLLHEHTLLCVWLKMGLMLHLRLHALLRAWVTGWARHHG